MKEFQALRSSLQEGTEDLTESQMLMPPNILILRRQTVRQYPGGLMVALYFNDKLKQYFSIPYGAPNVDSTITPTSLKEGVITEDPKLHQVGDEVRYRSGSESHLRAGKVVEVHPEHLMVHRKGAHGHYGYHYRVSKDHVVHNSRTGYTREELNEDAISHLQKVKAFTTDKPLYHKDGSQTRIDPTTAHALLSVHDALHPDNRKKFADALEHSKPKFHKMLDFAWKSVK